MNSNSKYDIEITTRPGYKLVDNDFHMFGIGQVVDDNGIAKFSGVLGSECDKTITEALEKYLKETVVVYLPMNNDLGTCSYKLDGKEIDGDFVDVYEGQSLELTFSLNKKSQSNYYLEKKIFGKEVYEKSYTITVKKNQAGKTLDLKDDFGLTVIKK